MSVDGFCVSTCFKKDFNHVDFTEIGSAGKGSIAHLPGNMDKKDQIFKS